MTTHQHKLVILGGGPAGLSAGLYAARSQLDHLMLEKASHGGQVMLTDWVDNYPGFPDGLSGFDLSAKMQAHADRFGLKSMMATVTGIEFDAEKKILALENGDTVICDALIICSGARATTIDVPGETELTGKGVSYCATCDGPFYRNQHVAVVGGGNTAVQEADHLTKFASKVTVIHRRDELRATKVVQDKAFANEKIEFLWDSHVTAIDGDDEVTQLQISNNDGSQSYLKVDGIFILIGVIPNNEMLPLDLLKSDDWGFIPTDGEMRTSIDGVFAAGDIRSKKVRQIINAAGEGATALLAAEQYLSTLK